MARDYRTILITGGAGFVGANLALQLKRQEPDRRVIAADNLRRRGSELNLPRLREGDVEFVHCDVRSAEDLRFAAHPPDLIVDCSADPSVLAGWGDAPDYVVNTNLLGTVNCLELARRAGADLLFLSTSRVYPVERLNQIATAESEERFILASEQSIPGVSARGVAEEFPLDGTRSLYGATKLCSELLIREWGAMYGLRAIVNRCGVLTGPWQLGTTEQGVFALWVAMHHFGRELRYIGWGGEGKQVRDLLHIDDLADLLDTQLARFDELAGQVFNVGGGTEGSLSLLETTHLCREITGRTVPIGRVLEGRPADLKVYITDNRRVTEATGWVPRRGPRQTLEAIHNWLQEAEPLVRHLWAG